MAAMLPYCAAYFLVWTAVLIVWVLAGFPLGPWAAALVEVPAHD